MAKKHTNVKNVITNWMGFSFPTIVLIFGFILLLLSIPIAFVNIVAASIPIFFGIALTSSFGTQINLNKQIYRDYVMYTFIKIGQWHSTKKFSCIVITNAHVGHRVSSRYNHQELALTNLVFQVCLMTPDHRSKHIVHRFKLEKDAIAYSKLLSEMMELEIARFNPIISKRTRDRRR